MEGTLKPEFDFESNNKVLESLGINIVAAKQIDLWSATK